MIITGIYAIQCTINGKLYVGSSVDVYKRYKRHKDDLRRGSHINRQLQADYNKHGLDNFVWLILEYVQNITDLAIREDYWGNYLLAREHGYNVIPFGDAPMRYMNHSEATKKKLADSWTDVKRAVKSQVVKDYWKDPIKRAEGLEVRRRESVRSKVSSARRKYWADADNRKHMSELKKGKPSPNKGKSMSEEQKRKIGASNKARWLEKMSHNER